MTATLSICIPTYNRSKFLEECLSSVLVSIAGHEREVEVLISDNSSTDNTGDVVRAFQETYPRIRYHRNARNIGAERNFRLLATLAKGDYIWIFGDDDKMEEHAVARVFESIRAGYNLTICNYSIGVEQLVNRSRIPVSRDQTFDDPNDLMKRFGLHLGYISSIVIKKDLFLKLPAEEYEAFAEYGFTFLFAVYNGVANGKCKAEFISEPLFRNRQKNSGDYDWYKYFVTGSSLIFDELSRKGYARSAVRLAKQRVFTDFVAPNVVGLKIRMNGQGNGHVLKILLKYYKQHWQLWAWCIPGLLTPVSLLLFARNIFRRLRHVIKHKYPSLDSR